MKWFNEPSKAYIDELHKYADYSAHNDMVRRSQEMYGKGTPDRMRMHLGVNPRYLLLSPRYNKTGLTFKEYSDNPRVMFECAVEFQYFMNMYVPYFHEMGKDAPIRVGVDFQNYAEPAWFGCPIEFPDNEVPYARPCLTEENRESIFETDLQPFGGLYEKIYEYERLFKEYASNYEFKGKKVEACGGAGGCMDGVFTLSCNLLGPTLACTLLYEDADYMRRLFDFLTDVTVRRLKAMRKRGGGPVIEEGWGFPDDSIAMLSTEMYREAILPFHKKLINALTVPGGKGVMHLCGDASRHFKTIQDELNCVHFDTGFPIDHEAVLKQLRPGTTVCGGPHVGFLEKATPAETYERVKETALRLKKVSKYFIMREANNLPPSAPLENCLAMYRAVTEHGVYTG